MSAPSSRLDELIDRIDLLLNTDLVKAESLANDVVVTARLAADTIREARGLHLRGWARFGLGDMAGALQDQLVALEMLTESSDEQTAGQQAEALVDPSRFRQILRNLVTNAIRYGGGRITVLVGSEGPMTTVEVRDSGVGIPFADREALFEPFQRGEGVDHGTRSIGLGLAVTRDLARLMNGDITYRHDGNESVFRLTLPACG